MLSQLRVAARRLCKSPGLTAVTVLSLALGIGVATTVFSIADAFSLRPLAVKRPQELVTVYARSETGLPDSLSFPEVRDLAQIPSIAAVAAFERRAASLRRGEEREFRVLQAVSDGYFETLGVTAALGRVLGPGMERGLPAPAVVISDWLFRARFGSDPTLVGRTIQVNGRPFTLLGVLPAGFRDFSRFVPTDLWVSLETWAAQDGSRESLDDRRARNLELIARLQPGRTAEQAASEAQVLGLRWAAAYPGASRGRTLHAGPALTVAGSVTPPAVLLLAAGLLVLLIACANVSTLLVALGDTRRDELWMRRALGASRARIAGQALADSALLATAGGVLGLGVAGVLVRSLPALLPPGDVPLDFAARLDRRALAVSALLAAVSSLAGGLVPALRAASAWSLAGPRVTVAAATPRRIGTLPALLVVAQVALAVVALDSSGLLFASFAATRSARHGFDSDRNVLALQILMGDERGDVRSWAMMLEDLRQWAMALPGVRHATFVRRLPMAGSGGGATVPVSVPGRAGADEPRGLRYNQVGPGYLETLGTRVRAGRFFLPSDHSGGSTAVVVSEAFARQWFPEGGAVGQHLVVDGRMSDVVGVVEDAPVEEVHESAQPFVYLPYARQPTREVALLVETTGDPAASAPAMKALVRQMRPAAQVAITSTLHAHMEFALWPVWAPAVLGCSLAAIGVLLALAGVYATVALATGRRTREIGVRMAVGARPADVLKLVTAQGLFISGVGALAGVPGALGVGMLMRGALYGVGATDPRVLTASVAAALTMGLVTSAFPAWRATQTDAATVLRAE